MCRVSLRNKLNIRNNPELLSKKEAAIVASRRIDLERYGLPTSTGFQRLKDVHRELFKDVYEWAGKPRTMDIGKSEYAGSFRVHHFTPAQDIEAEGKRVFDALGRDRHFKGLNPKAFVDKGAEFFAAINQLHPFREGNGRTQRVFFEGIAKEAGYDVSFKGVSHERVVDVAIRASRGDLEPTKRLLAEAIHPGRRAALEEATAFLDQHPASRWNNRYIATTEPKQKYSGTFVSANGQHFMFHDGANSIHIGQVKDLPAGMNPKPSDRIDFTATEWPTPKKDKHLAVQRVQDFDRER